jgi:hypothetical protein
LDVYDPGAQIPATRVEIGIAVDHHPEVGAGIPIGIPGVIRSESVAVVAEEARIIVVSVHLVFGEVQAIGDVLPVRDQGSNVVVHGQIRILVDLAARLGKIPSPRVVGVPELPKVEGFRRRHDEEVPHSRIVVHEPVG